MPTDTKDANLVGQDEASCCCNRIPDAAPDDRSQARHETPVADDGATAPAPVTAGKSKGCRCND